MSVKPRKSHFQIINQAVSLYEVNDTERRLISFLNANGAAMTWTHKDAGTTLVEGLALEMDLTALGVRRAIKSLRDKGWVRLFTDLHVHPVIQLNAQALVVEAVRLQQMREYRRWIGPYLWAQVLACRTDDERQDDSSTMVMLLDLYQQAVDLAPGDVSAYVLKGGLKRRMAFTANRLIKDRQAHSEVPLQT